MYIGPSTKSYVSFISINLNYGMINLDSVKEAVEYLTNEENNPECNACYAKPIYLFVRVYGFEQIWLSNYCKIHAFDANHDYEDYVYVKFSFDEICSNKNYDKILNSINVLRKSLLLK